MSKIPALHVCISHGEDFDGLASQVLIRRYWKERGYKNCEFYRVKYGTIQSLLVSLVPRIHQKLHLVIADINFMDRIFAPLNDLVGKNTSNSLVYYDHHQSSREKQERISLDLNCRCFFGPDERCTTLLIQEHLFPKDPQAIFLAQEANHSDLKDAAQSPNNRLLGRLIAMKATANFEDPEIDRFVSILAQSNFYADSWLQSRMEENNRICQTDLQFMLESAAVSSINHVTVACGWAKFASPGEIATELLKKKTIDIAIGLNLNGKGSVKSRNPEFRADLIAGQWGGGGHEDRAGFDWDYKIYTPQIFFQNEAIPKITILLKSIK